MNKALNPVIDTRSTAGMRRSIPRRTAGIALISACCLLGAACGDSNGVSKSTSAPDPTDSPTTVDKPVTTKTPIIEADTTVASEPPTTSEASDPAATTVGTGGSSSAGGAIAGVDAAQSGAIQIIAQGSLRDPEIGTYTEGSSGSGFFISADGYAVTNNHVVTGAATLEVYVGGDLATSYNAQVIGVSECNDLALIKVGTPGDVPYFDWFDGDVQAGLDVYAAGFPLGDPEFTLTKGIVAKAKAGGDLTGTSSIDHTIEHDAAIQPGNSGGPLLSTDGEVVGINYAGGARDIGAQYYAISSDLAQEVVAELADGDFESIGVNGYAIADEASGITGIWVSGVAAGTPASTVGLLPGDIITAMNGLPVGTDGTFKDYCDVIRTAGDKPIAVQVLRYDTQEIPQGEINGEQALTATVSFGEGMATENSVEEGAAYTDYVQVTDDTGTLTLEVPAEWADIATSPLENEGETYPRIEAATDIDSFNSTFGVPGVKFLAVPAAGANIDDLLYGFGVNDCTDGGITDYDDGAFVGKYQVWEACAGTDALYLVLVTNLIGHPDTLYVTTIQAVTTADLDALDHILQTFNAAG